MRSNSLIKANQCHEAPAASGSVLDSGWYTASSTHRPARLPIRQDYS